MMLIVIVVTTRFCSGNKRVFAIAKPYHTAQSITDLVGVLIVRQDVHSLRRPFTFLPSVPTTNRLISGSALLSVGASIGDGLGAAHRSGYTTTFIAARYKDLMALRSCVRKNDGR